MPELVKITVRASEAHPDVLTVQDAMRQVLDIFAMLQGDDAGVEWKLLRASTNSPFHIEGEAVSFIPNVDISVIARAQKTALARNLREVVSGRTPNDPEFEIKTAKGLLARNLNGIGSTEIDLGLGEPIVVTPTVARVAIQALDRSPATSDLFEMPHPRDEIGSIEGKLLTLGTHWNHPAVLVQEGLSKVRVWCRLSADLAKTFESKTSFQDVWQHRPVRVRGRIKFDQSGNYDYVLASDIIRLEERSVSLETIRDPDFTSGLSIVEYLDRFRDGALG